MTLYRYTGRHQGGKVQGEVEAVSAREAATVLQRRGIDPLTITPAPPDSSLRLSLPAGKPAVVELIHFTRHLQTLSEASVPLARGVVALGSTTRSRLLGQAIQRMLHDLQTGHSLSAALSRHPALFSPLYVAMVKTGEENGRLGEALGLLVGYLESERERHRLIIQTLRYPLFVLAAIGLALGVIQWLVLPAFVHIFQQFRAELPLPTRLLMAGFQWVGRWGWWVLALVAGSAILTRMYIAGEEGRNLWDRSQLRLPVTGAILHQALAARFARVLAMGTRSGLAIGHTLEVAALVVGNRWFAQRIRAMRGSVERGTTLTGAATDSGLFSPLVLQMFAVGEESGALDRAMEDAARYFEQEVSYQTRSLGAWMEPILVVLVSGLVLLLALGVFLPIWQLGSASLR